MAHPAPTHQAVPAGSSAGRDRTLHADDLYTWVQEQVALLRAGRWEDLDLGNIALGNIAQELSDVGPEQYDKLESTVEMLLAHALKWDHQPERRSRSWSLTIAEQRARIERQLRKNPGLRPRVTEAVVDVFRIGRLRAAREMRRSLRSLPANYPYTWDDILNRPFELDGDR